MLVSLSIKDFALIKELNLVFSSRLNIITGETGAGKSIILGAIHLVIGDKATTDLIRTGTNRAVVEAIFYIDDKTISKQITEQLNHSNVKHNQHDFTLKREVSMDGKGRCFINHTKVPISVLKNIGRFLLDIHSQNEHQGILKTDTHLHILDRYAQISDQTAIYKKLYLDYTALNQQLKSVTLSEEEKSRRISLLKHEIQEIESADLTSELELENLISQEKRLLNSEAITQCLTKGHQLLSGTDTSILPSLATFKSNLETVTEYDDALVDSLKNLEDAYFALEEVNHALRSYVDVVQTNTHDIQLMRDRIDTLNNILNRYGKSFKHVALYLEEAKNELHGLEFSGEQEKNIRMKINEIRQELETLMYILSQKRTESAKELQDKINQELASLNMSDTLIKISVKWELSNQAGESMYHLLDEETKKTYKMHKNGLDFVEFFIGTTADSSLKSLKKVASGGELSRIVLSLKKVIIDSNYVPTMIFDEVDTGVGGQTAEQVGKKLLDLAQASQLIVITHLHQIAAINLTDTKHFYVSKNLLQGTMIQDLTPEQRVEELARMMGGDNVNDAVLEHAKNLLSR